MKTANFNKNNEGLIPAIVQDEQTRNVLMLGYMNEEALEKTQSSGKVTFFSRSKQRLWTKGEESGNFLFFKSYKVDCDQDTLLAWPISRNWRLLLKNVRITHRRTAM
jgi:phosphoribosyl-ATP pyrophosphohydrolase/phosphoribosyl-AMP cyclohydrolase